MLHVTRLLVAALLLVLLPLPAQASHTDDRVPVYFADWTVADWPVWEAVKRWNRNDVIRLRQVPACSPSLTPCVTLIDKWAYDGPVYDPQQVAGTWWSSHVYDLVVPSGDVIEVYNWWDTSRQNRERLVCHELAHFIYQSGEHPPMGCLHPTRWDWFWPGQRLLRNVPTPAPSGS